MASQIVSMVVISLLALLLARPSVMAQTLDLFTPNDALEDDYAEVANDALVENDTLVTEDAMVNAGTLVPDGAEVLEGLSVDQEAYDADLSTLKHDGRSPRFTDIQMLIGREGPSHEVVLPLVTANPNAVISIMSEIIINPGDKLTSLDEKLWLDHDTTKTLENLAETLYADIKLADNERKITLLTAKAHVWQAAAKFELLWITHYAAHIDTRRMAAAQLLNALKQTEDTTYIYLARSLRERLFTTCDTFAECFDMLSQLAIAMEAMPAQIVDQEFSDQIFASLESIQSNDPFLINILKYRFQSIRLGAKFFTVTELNEPHQQGKQPRIELGQIAELREELEALIGPDGFWQTAIRVLRDRYDQRIQNEVARAKKALEAAEQASTFEPSDDASDEEPPKEDPAKISAQENLQTLLKQAPLTDHELMVEAISEHMYLIVKNMSASRIKMDDHGMIPEIWRQRAERFKAELLDAAKVLGLDVKVVENDEQVEEESSEQNPEQNDLDEKELANRLQRERDLVLIHSLPAQVASGLTISYHMATAYRFYLKRLEFNNAMPFLDILNVAISGDGLLKQKSIEPIAAFLALVYFSRYEYKLPHRDEWHATLRKYASEMLKHASNLATTGDLLEHDFLTPQFITTQVVASDEHYSEINRRLKTFIANANLKQFWGNNSGFSNKSTGFIEKWLAERIPGFHSLYHQWLEVGEAEQHFQKALGEVIGIKGEISYQKYVEEKLSPRTDQYFEKVLTAACYGYWFPVDAQGQMISQDQINNSNMKQIVAIKPEWQTTYQFRKTPDGDILSTRVFDLRQVCGGNPKQVSQEVLKFFNHDRVKDLPQDNLTAWAQQISYVGGDIGLVLMSASITGAVSKLGLHRATWGTTKFFVRNTLARKAMFWAGRVGAILSSHLNRQNLRHAAFFGTQMTFSAAANLSTFILVRHSLDATVEELKERTGSLTWLPSKPFWDYDPKQNLAQNVWSNFGTEFAMGLPLFMIVPATTALAHRQVYTKSLTGRSKVRLKQFQIEKYIRSYGRLRSPFKRNGFVNEFSPTGFGMREELGYIALPMIYNIAIFGSVPTLHRGFQYYFLDGSDHPWQGWSVFLKEDLRYGALYSGAFTLWRTLYSNPSYNRSLMRQVKVHAQYGTGPDWLTQVQEPPRFKLYHTLGLRPPSGRQGRPITKQEIEQAFNSARARGVDVHEARNAAKILINATTRQAYDAAEINSNVRSFGRDSIPRDLKICTYYFKSRITALVRAISRGHQTP